MTENYYETSFRFKWGTGFIIEALSVVIKKHGEFLPVTYLLEGQSYSFDRTEGEFVESDSENSLATPTNFVLLLSEATLKKLFALADTLGAHLKNELIVEFSNVPEPAEPDEIKNIAEPVENAADDARKENLRQIYDHLPLIEAILTYTQLSVEYGETACVITDPAPKKMTEDQHFFG